MTTHVILAISYECVYVYMYVGDILFSHFILHYYTEILHVGCKSLPLNLHRLDIYLIDYCMIN